jgi:homoserine kinase
MHDVIVEPARAHLIPGFHEVKEAALGAGALACSISGGGPTLFDRAGDAAGVPRHGEPAQHDPRLAD